MKRTLLFFVSLFLLLFVCSMFLLTTESGLVVIQKSVNRFAGGVISIGQARGRLLGDWTVNDIRFVSAGTDIGVEKVECVWHPENLFKAEFKIAKLIVSGVNMALKEDPESTPAGDVAQLPGTLLPFTVLLERLVFNKLVIVDTNGESLLLVDRMITRLEGNADRLSVREFDLQGPDIGLVLHGNIEVNREWALELSGNWRLAGFGFHQMSGTFSASGPLRNPHLELGVESPASIRVVADLVELLEKPEWTAKLEAKDVDLSKLIVDCPKIELATITADLSGDFANYRGRIQAVGNWHTLEEIHLVSDLAGDFLAIDFQRLRLDIAESSVEALGGKISWRDIFSWDGRFLLKNFDPSIITEELQGRFTAELVSAGDVKESGGVVASFDILSLDGEFREQTISAKGKVFLSETTVKTDGLTIRSGDVTGLAHLENGMFSWAEEPHWSAKIRLDHFDPSCLYPEFTGSVNGEVNGEGRLGKHGPEASVTIKKLSGTLRGNKLSGGGEITLSADTFKTTGLVLKSGPSELVVNGRAGESLALDFSLTSPDIGTLLPESQGSLLFRGSLKGTRNEPQLDAKLVAAGLSYQENSLAQAQAEIQARLKSDGRLNGSLTVEKMSLAGFAIDKGAVEIKGSLAEHELVVRSAGTIGELGFKARGTYQDEWRGELSHFQLAAENYGVWRQQKSVAVTAGRDGVLLERFCLADGESAVCLAGDVRLGKEFVWKVRTELSSVPLAWLNRLQLFTVPVSGEINADIAANGDSRRVLSANVESRLSAASLSMNADDIEPVPFNFADSTLSIQMTDGLLRGDINIRMQNDSQLVLSANVEGAGDFSAPLNSLPLTGNLKLQEFDMALLDAFTGYSMISSGRVNNSLTLSGTVGQPKIYGKIDVHDGGIELPYQGITLENIVLSIEAREDAAQLKGKATSGPGQLTAAGTVRYGAKGIEGALNIQGDDFLLVNLPEYAVRINPDVLLTFSNGAGEIRGTIDVPYGLIAPEEMRDSISVSEDVIIVNGTKEERVNNLPIKPNLKVRLGDDVRIDGYGLTGKLEGELSVIATQDDALSGRGKLKLVEGTFAMYGQGLTIERGRVLFTGGPLDNPGIDVRAQRKIIDKESRGDSITVGIDISGFVQDLQYHLFSDPFMEETEILSYMIVGQSLANSTEQEGNMLEAAAMMLGTKGSSGFAKDLGRFMLLDDLHLEGSGTKENMSLVVGKRLTDDLYIGYDLNMFSQLGKFRIRYDLTRGFSVETRSSAESTGADLIYSFER